MFKYGWKLVVFIIIGIALFYWFTKAAILSTYLTNKMRVPVSIGSISMRPSQTTMANFKIENPRGFKTDAAFKAANTTISYQFSNLISNPTIIDNIEVSDIYWSVECSNPLCSENNWTVIGANAVKREESDSNREVLIHHLVLSNLTVEIRGLGLQPGVTVKRIPRLEFYDIDSKKGFPTGELIKAVFGGAGLMQYIQQIFNPQNLLPKGLSPFKVIGDSEE